ncbi:MAG: cyclodeaminase/cyclohydrolase family protein [Bacteroidota bacterium]
MLTKKSVGDFLDSVASNAPAPGGGSVSALAGALGAALTSMVARLTIGKKKYADVQEEMEDVLRKSEELRARITAVIDEDTLAFNKVMQAFGMPKESDDQKSVRNIAIQEATRNATEVPLRLIELCARSIDLAKTVAVKGNKNSASDAGVAILMLRAAAQGALLNVKINLAGIEDAEFRKIANARSSELLARIDRVASDANSLLL